MSQNLNIQNYPEWVKTLKDEDLCEGDSRSVWQATQYAKSYLLERVSYGHSFRNNVLATLDCVPVDSQTMKPYLYGEIVEITPGVYECHENSVVQKLVFDLIGNIRNLNISEDITGTEVMASFKDLAPGQVVDIHTGPDIKFDGRLKSWTELSTDERRHADQYDANSAIVSIKILSQPNI